MASDELKQLLRDIIIWRMLLKLPSFFSSKKQPSQESKTSDDFLVAEINQEKISLGFFTDQDTKPALVASVTEDRKADLFVVFNSSLGALAEKNPNLPNRAIIGINDPKIETMTTIARLNREKMHEEMTSEDIERVLTQVGEDYNAHGKQLFFSSVTSAVLDGVRIGNPIGARGSVLELGCFNAYLEKEKLDLYEKVAQEAKLDLEKIVPLEYCIVRAFLDSGTKDGILLRILKDFTTLSFVEESNIVGVKTFSLGSSEPDFWGEGLKIALQDFSQHPRWPTLVSFYDTENQAVLEKVAKETLEKNFANLKEVRFENLNTRLGFAQFEASLYALSVEGETL